MPQDLMLFRIEIISTEEISPLYFHLLSGKFAGHGHKASTHALGTLQISRNT